MEVFYYMVFGILSAVVAALELSKSNKDRINTSQPFNSFKNNYLLVYSLMMGKPIADPTLPLLFFVYAFAFVHVFVLQFQLHLLQFNHCLRLVMWRLIRSECNNLLELRCFFVLLDLRFLALVMFALGIFGLFWCGWSIGSSYKLRAIICLVTDKMKKHLIELDPPV